MKAKVMTVEIIKDPVYGSIPGIIRLGHRHLEKEVPNGVACPDGLKYTIPVDLLTLGSEKPPFPFWEDIEEVQFVYGTKGNA